MVTENAIETLRALKTQWANDTHKQSQSLAELETALELPRTPNRIECYDISNTQGTLSVGSMVVFEQGIPRKAHYRRFNIKTVENISRSSVRLSRFHPIRRRVAARMTSPVPPRVQERPHSPRASCQKRLVNQYASA